MTPALQLELELPATVNLSIALAGEGPITATGYNGAQVVAELEDGMKRPFCNATWARVLVGDTVLMSWASLDRIVEVEIEQLATEQASDGKLLVIARYIAFGLEFGQVFYADETVYVQSRF